jgi:glycolate oxidase iron-sulfur subunit
VAYGRLVDIGREVVEAQVQRPVHARALRWVLRQVLSRRSLFTPLLRTGQLLRPLAPAPLKRQIPPRVAPGPRPAATHARKMLILDGCVQPGIAPLTNAATARVLDRLGIEVVTAAGAGCCGAVSHHLSAADEARDYMRRNIDAWWPQVEAGAEAIIMTASGCGAVVKDYGQILADDPAYAEKAARIAGLTKDLSEILGQEDLSALGRPGEGRRIAFHPPCSLQHAQQLKGVVEPILEGIGFELLPIRDAHLCCGSAGTYSILQETLSQELLARKLENLQAPRPELIATANIGCQAHLASRAGVPVIHWISLLDEVGAAA